MSQAPLKVLANRGRINGIAADARFERIAAISSGRCWICVRIAGHPLRSVLG